MLTEVPVELSEKADFNGMISLYCQQLDLFADIRTTILDLFTAGHFEFQESFDQSFPASTPASVLADDAARLAELSQVTRVCACVSVLPQYCLDPLEMV